MKKKFPKEDAEKFKKYLRRNAWFMVFWAYLDMALLARSIIIGHPWWVWICYIMLTWLFLSTGQRNLKSINHIEWLELHSDMKTTEEHLKDGGK